MNWGQIQGSYYDNYMDNFNEVYLNEEFLSVNANGQAAINCPTDGYRRLDRVADGNFNRNVNESYNKAINNNTNNNITNHMNNTRMNNNTDYVSNQINTRNINRMDNCNNSNRMNNQMNARNNANRMNNQMNARNNANRMNNQMNARNNANCMNTRNNANRMNNQMNTRNNTNRMNNPVNGRNNSFNGDYRQYSMQYDSSKSDNFFDTNPTRMNLPTAVESVNPQHVVNSIDKNLMIKNVVEENVGLLSNEVSAITREAALFESTVDSAQGMDMSNNVNVNTTPDLGIVDTSNNISINEAMNYQNTLINNNLLQKKKKFNYLSLVTVIMVTVCIVAIAFLVLKANPELVEDNSIIYGMLK